MQTMTEVQTATLRDRALVTIEGRDQVSFLQGLLTQDVQGRFRHKIRYGALLTPQGRLRWDLFIYRDGGRHRNDGVVFLDVAASARDELIDALKSYRLRADVLITAAEFPIVAMWGAKRKPPSWVHDPRLPDLGFRGFGQPINDTEGDYRAHRIGLGIADPAEDGIEPLYPIDANLDLLNGIDFQKGCYVGQETTSRMKRRGQVRSRIAAVNHDGPALPMGAEVLTAEGLRAGRTLSGIDGRSLALLRIDRAMAGDLTVDGRPVRLSVPTWLEPAFRVAAVSQVI